MSRTITYDWFAEARSEDLPTQLRLIERLRKGVSFKELTRLIDLIGMSGEEMAAVLSIPPRTFARRKERAGRLAQGESERFVRLVKVLAIGRDVFGSLETAKSWMERENRALGGVSPNSLLDTDIGTQAVVDVLGRIEHGIYS